MIKAYCRLREMVDPYLPISRVPQLLLTGFGSIDDPQGQVIYEEVLDYIDEEIIGAHAHDILAVKLPPSDQLMGALLQKTYICLQLSVREGFEIKVTEAISKSVPVIVYNTGGLPRQVCDGKSGFIVEPGDTERVASIIADLLSSPQKYNELRNEVGSSLSYQLCSPFHATSWLWLANRLLNHGPCDSLGNMLKLNSQFVNSRLVGNFWNIEE